MIENMKLFSHAGRACIVIQYPRNSVAYVELFDHEDAFEVGDTLEGPFIISLIERNQLGLDSGCLTGESGYSYMEKRIKDLAEALQKS